MPADTARTAAELLDLCPLGTQDITGQTIRDIVASCWNRLDDPAPGADPPAPLTLLPDAVAPAVGDPAESDPLTLAGPTGAVWPACVRGDAGAELSVNGGPWAGATVVIPGDSLRVRLTPPSAGTYALTLYLPGRTVGFSVTVS